MNDSAGEGSDQTCHGSGRRILPDLTGLDLLGSGVLVLDVEGRVAFANMAACQLLAMTPRRMRGCTPGELLPDLQALDAPLDQLRSQAWGQQGVDITLMRPGQPPLALHCLAVVLEDTGGMLLVELHEIERRRRIDRETRLHESARASRAMLRQLAHEVRNPLGGIRGAAQLLEADAETDAVREYTGVIIQEVDRLQQLVDRLLAPGSGRRAVARINIHEVCEQVRRLVQAEYAEGLVIERDYDASLPELEADRAQLVQALLNLVRNAAQAMQGRGTILLRTRVARQVVIAHVGYRLALALDVIDDGPGVSPTMQERMFLPLVSGREGGSGLGLPVAQGIVEAHGGSIECESRPGWTDFRILLPLL